MSPRPPGIKAEDVPAPTRREFEDFVKKLVNVPKTELDKRERVYRRRKKKTTPRLKRSTPRV